MPISLEATRDATDAVTALTLSGAGLVPGQAFRLTINGNLIGTATVKPNGTLNFAINNVSTLPAAVQTAINIFCSCTTTDDGSLACGMAAHALTLSITVS